MATDVVDGPRCPVAADYEAVMKFPGGHVDDSQLCREHAASIRRHHPEQIISIKSYRRRGI